MRNAKIVCTLGPASDSRRAIRDLAAAGMSVARLNASHGSTADRADLVERIHAVDAETDSPIAAMVDLQGPEIRTADIDEPIELVADTTVTFAVGDTATPDRVGLSTPILGVEPGDKVLLDDGRIETTVETADGDVVTAHVDSGGELGARKGVNVPGVDLDLDVPTDDDLREIEMAVEQDADFVAASFVRSAADVYSVSEAVEDAGGEIPVIAKIERAGAVENLEEIVDAAYGVMVARGDLGVECPMEDVPVIQKRIIRECRETGTPVITATEMLDSMVSARRPTRAEASDVANAVLDGTDAVMLSGETAIGDHPVRVVEAMDRIVTEIENSEEYDELREQRVPIADDSRTDALARSSRYLARDLGASAVVAATESGYTALKTAKFRPQVPIVAATTTDQVRRQLALSWGITSKHVPFVSEGVDEVIEKAVGAAIDAEIAESGDTVVVMSGMMSQMETTGAGTTNMLKVHVAAETLARGRGVVDGRIAGPVANAPDGDLTDVEPGSILVLDGEFEGEFTGDADALAGIVSAVPGMTGYAAVVARELGIPMVSGASLDVAAGTVVTIDGGRGVVYEGDVRTRRELPDDPLVGTRRD